jgi:hypothetical protein
MPDEKTTELIKAALTQAKNPICLWSGDARSQLLLHFIYEIRPMPILIFKDWWDDLSLITTMVQEQEITAYFYRPVQMDYKDGAITSYYNLAQKVLPITTDVVKSNRCGLDWGRKVMQSRPIPYYNWDVTFAGSKDHSQTQFNTDEHSLIMPLADWTDDDVARVVADLHIPVSDQRTWHGCMACQDSKDYVWCVKENRMIQGIQHYGKF